MSANHDIAIADDRIRAVRKRDRDRCQGCFEPEGSVNHLEIHRIVPIEKGGKDRMSNLILLCDECHEEVHDDQHVAIGE